MSASREKKKRQELTEAGISPKQLKAEEAAKKKRKTTITFVVVTAVLIIAIAAGVFVNNGYIERHTDALTVDGYTLSAAEMGIYYSESISSFMNQYGSYLSGVIDTSVPLDEQIYDEETGETWADNFLTYAAEQAKEVYAIYAAAMEDGYTLTEEDKTNIDAAMESLDTYAKSGSYSSASKYLKAVYGRGVNTSVYEDYVTVRQIASSYISNYIDSLEYTEDDISTYFQENKHNYKNVTYRYFYIPAENYIAEDADAADETVKATALEQAKADAAAMAEACKNNEAAFATYAYDLSSEDNKETYQDENATLVENAEYSDVVTYLADWLFDDARTQGETYYVAADASSSGYYVCYFIGSESYDYNTVNVRHILISPEDTEDEQSVADAKAEAESILAEFEENPTEENFAALADEYSDDSAEGGLYENVYKGQMVEEFEAWCYDSSRTAGQTGIVQTSYGFHVMYFVGTGENYTDVLVKEDLQENDYTQWHDALLEDSSYKLLDGKKWVIRSVPIQ